MTRKSSPRTPLPATLGASFTRAEALAHGVTEGRYRGRDVHHPFRGVATRHPPTTIGARCAAFARKMRGRWWFSHITAALLMRMPLPRRFDDPARPLDVTVPKPHTPPRDAGCTGHTITDPKIQVIETAPVPVIAPADTWCQLSMALDREDLVAVGDYLLSGHPRDRPRLPLATLCQLREAAARYRGRRGAKKLSWALARVRPGVDSRPESLLRLLLLSWGLPEPMIADPTPVDGGRVVLHPDLKLPRWLTVVEYEGDGHRDREQWLSDIDRYALLRAAGWEVIQVTAADLFRDREKFRRRVFATLGRRGFARHPHEK
jgi:hypothetical protein